MAVGVGQNLIHLLELSFSPLQDGRYSSFYMSDGALLALDFPDDDDFGVIPPFDDGKQLGPHFGSFPRLISTSPCSQ